MSKSRFAALGCAAASLLPASTAFAYSEENGEVKLLNEDKIFYCVPQSFLPHLSFPTVFENPEEEPTLDPNGLICWVLPQSFLPKGRQAVAWPEGEEVALDPHASIFYVWPQRWLPGGWKDWITKQEKDRDTEMHQEAVNDPSALVFYVSILFISPQYTSTPLTIEILIDRQCMPQNIAEKVMACCGFQKTIPSTENEKPESSPAVETSATGESECCSSKATKTKPTISASVVTLQGRLGAIRMQEETGSSSVEAKKEKRLLKDQIKELRRIE
jgi:hypothetical protein